MTDPFTVRLLNQPSESFDPVLDSCEAYVIFDRGKRTYFANVFTPEGIKKIMDKDTVTGESSGGTWFWCSDLLIVRRIDEEHVRKAVAGLLEEGCFEAAFDYCPETNGRNSTRAGDKQV